MFSQAIAKLRKHRSDSRHRNSGRPSHRPLRLEALETRLVLSTTYIAHDLVSDQPGVAPLTDPTLLNAWGISLGPTGPTIWVSSNHGGVSELYTGDVNGTPLIKNPTWASSTFPAAIPPARSSTPRPTSSSRAAERARRRCSSSPPSRASSAAGIPTVDAEQRRRRLHRPRRRDLQRHRPGQRRRATSSIATDFHNSKIDVFDKLRRSHPQAAGTFTDPNLPAGYAPFGIANIGGKLYVSYASRTPTPKTKSTAPAWASSMSSPLRANSSSGSSRRQAQRPVGHGAGDRRLRRLQQRPAGRQLRRRPHQRLQSDDRQVPGHAEDGRQSSHDRRPVGPGVRQRRKAGDTNTLYFAAGPDDEAHGLFGKITANAPGTSAVNADLNGDELDITAAAIATTSRCGSPAQKIVVEAGGQQIGAFAASAVSTIHVQGFAGNDSIEVSSAIKIKTILDGGAGKDSILAAAGPTSSSAARATIPVRRLRPRPADRRHRKDSLFGDGNSDILIGGETTHDGNAAALLAILAEWNSAVLCHADRQAPQWHRRLADIKFDHRHRRRRGRPPLRRPRPGLVLQGPARHRKCAHRQLPA